MTATRFTPDTAIDINLDFDGWRNLLPAAGQKRLVDQLAAVPDPEEVKRRLQNQMWIAADYGVHPSQLNGRYDQALAAYSVRAGWGPIVDSAAFNARVKQEAGNRHNERLLLNGDSNDTPEAAASREASLAARAYWDAAEESGGRQPEHVKPPLLPRDDRDAIKGFSAWQSEAQSKPGYNAKSAGKYWIAWSRAYALGKQDREVAANTAERALSILQRSDANTTAGMADALPLFRGLTPQQRSLAFREMARRAVPNDAVVESIGAKAGQAFQRSVIDFADSVQTAISMPYGTDTKLKEGGLLPPDSYNQLVADMGKGEPTSNLAQGVPLSKEQADFLNAKIDEYRNDNETFEQLKDVARGIMDPIRKDSIPDYAAVGAAESVPAMAAAAYNPAVAVIYYKQDAERKLRNEGGLSYEQAAKLGPWVGAAQSGLDYMQFGFLKKAPGLAGLLQKWSGNASANFATRYAGTLVAEGVIELAQDEIAPAFIQQVGAWFDSELPGVQWSKVAGDVVKAAPETFASMLLLPLIGAGRATINDVRAADAIASDPAALQKFGFSPSHIAAIQLAGESEAGGAAKMLRRLWSERKPVMEGDSKSLSPSEAASVYVDSQADSGQTNNLSDGAIPADLPATAGDPTRDALGNADEVRRDGLYVTPGDTLPRDVKKAPVTQPAAIIEEQNAEAGIAEVRRNADGWYILRDDGTRIQAGEAETVDAIRRHLAMANTEKGARAIMAIADQIANRDVNTESRFTGDALAVIEGQPVRKKRDGSTENITFQQETARNLNAQLEYLGGRTGVINGSNWIGEDGLRIAQINQGVPGALTQVHEFAEGRFREIIRRDSGASSVAAAKVLARLPQFKPETQTNDEARKLAQSVQNIAAGKTNETEVRETLVELAVADVVGRRKSGEYFEPGSIADAITEAMVRIPTAAERKALGWFRSMLKAVKLYLHGVFSTAAKLNKARREGKIQTGDDFTRLVDEMLGVSEQRRHNEAVIQEAQQYVPVEGETFSLGKVTPAQDAEYLAAVEAGDMVKAQRMVNEAAKTARLIESEGFFVPVKGAATQERIGGDTRLYRASDDLYAEDGQSFSEELSTADAYRHNAGFGGPNIYAYDVDTSKSMKVDGMSDLSKRVAKGLPENVKEWMETRGFNAPIDVWIDQGFGYTHDPLHEQWGPKGFNFQEHLRDQGYDWIVFEDEVPAGAITHWLLKEVGLEGVPIKSADPVTYDDAGNVIPLSQRFNPNRDEITFSLASANALEVIARNMESATPRTPEQRLAMVQGGLTEAEAVMRIEAAGREVAAALMQNGKQRIGESQFSFDWVEADDPQFEGDGWYSATWTSPDYDSKYLEQFVPLPNIALLENGKFVIGEGWSEYESLGAAKAAVIDGVAEYLRENTGVYGANLDGQRAAADVFAKTSELFKPFGDEWGGTKWGSWYYDAKAEDGSPLKISIRDHSATRADMGLPVRSFFVSKDWNPQDVAGALSRAYVWLTANAASIAESGVAFSLASANALEVIARNMEAATPRTPEQRLAMVAKAAENLRGIQRVWQYNDAQSGGLLTTQAAIEKKRREMRWQREAELLQAVEADFGDIEEIRTLASPTKSPVLSEVFTQKEGQIPRSRIKTEPKDSTGGEYDGAQELPSWMFGGSMKPDDLAQELYDAGFINDPSPDAMWTAITKELQTSAKMKQRLKDYSRRRAEAKQQARDEAAAWADKQDAGKGEAAAQREEIRRSLIAFEGILMAVPSELRGKIGGFATLSTLTTDKARFRYLLGRADKATQVFETWLRKEYTAGLDRLVERALAKTNVAGEKAASKVGADAAYLLKAMDEARGFDEVKVTARIGELQQRIDSGELTDDQVALNMREQQLVQLAGNWYSWDAVTAHVRKSYTDKAGRFHPEVRIEAKEARVGADAAQMSAAYDAAKETFTDGWLAWSKKVVAKRERRAAVREALSVDTGAAGTRAERVARADKDLGWKGGLKNWALNLSSFQEVASYVFGEGSQEANAIVEREREASNAKEDEVQGIQDSLEEMFTKLTGSAYKGTVLQWELAQRTIDHPKTGKIAQLEAIQALLMWAQPDGQRHMEAFDYKQADMDALRDALTPEAREVQQWLRKQYDAEYAPLNALYRERFGVNLPSHDNYAPITVTPNQQLGSDMVDPVTGVATTGSILSPGSLRTRSRTATAEPEFRDALKTYLGHVRQLAHWKAYYDLATDMQSIFGNRELANKIEAAGGKEALNTLRSWKDFFAQGGHRDAAAYMAINAGLNKGIGRASQMILFGRVGTLLIQSTQLGAALAEMPLGAYLKRFGMLWFGKLGWGDAIKSEFIQRRLSQQPPVVRQAMKSLAASKPNRIKHAAHAVGRLISGADAIFTAGTYAITLDYHRTKGAQAGLSGAELESYAHAEAERSTERVAQPIRTGAKSIYENTGGTSQRLIWYFASEARQKIALAAWAIRNGRKHPAKLARTLAVVLGVGGIAAAFIRSAWKDIKDDDDEEVFDEKNWNLKRILSQSAAGPLQGVPVVGDAIEGFPQGGIMSSAEDGITGAKKLVTGKADDAEEVWKASKAILTSIGFLNDTLASLAALSNVADESAKVADAMDGKEPK